ncbi:MAG: hypothetical protein ACI86M_001375 [Saprospiraceae bacterium]|jgi:hypothetical protein
MRNTVLTYRLFLFLGISLVVLLVNNTYGQSQANISRYSLDTTEITDLKELVKYEEKKRKLVPKKRAKQEKKEKKKEIKERESLNLGGLGTALQYLLYLGIIILVVVILVMVFSNITLEKKLDAIAPLDLEDVEDIETIDAKSGLEIALDAENYREAVRMLFIQLLQVLVIDESIAWKPKKTNRDYLREMSDHEKVAHFRILVMAYERVWYGSEEIDRPFFDHLRKDFERFYSTQDLKLGHEE